MDFHESDECTKYVTINSLMVECDYLEETGQAGPEQELMRLQYREILGEKLKIREAQQIVDLQNSLGIRGNKFELEPQSIAILSRPFGTKYRALAIRGSDYGTTQCNLLWDNHPIDTVWINFNTEIRWTARRLRSSRLNRVQNVAFWGQVTESVADTLRILIELALQNCSTLAVPQSVYSKNLLGYLQLNWPCLREVMISTNDIYRRMVTPHAS